MTKTRDFSVISEFLAIYGDAVAMLATLYPDEFAKIDAYTSLKEPVFYGPRFRNVNTAP